MLRVEIVPSSDRDAPSSPSPPWWTTICLDWSVFFFFLDARLDMSSVARPDASPMIKYPPAREFDKQNADCLNPASKTATGRLDGLDVGHLLLHLHR